MASTYRDIVHLYAHSVGNGTSDADLNPRVRRLVVILLNTAANDYAATAEYPPADRDAIVRRFHDGQWSANVATIIDALSPSGRAAYSDAIERATEILRNV